MQTATHYEVCWEWLDEMIDTAQHRNEPVEHDYYFPGRYEYLTVACKDD